MSSEGTAGGESPSLFWPGLYSDKLGPLAESVDALKAGCAQLWWESQSEVPEPSRIFSLDEQIQQENEISEFVDRAKKKIGAYPESGPSAQDAWLDEFIAMLREFGTRRLFLSDTYLDSVFQRGFIDSTRDFIERVKRFDPDLEIGLIYQALRNVWIMNTLQIYLETAVGHSDSIFAYSLLYPYTDNVFDDASLPFQRKRDLIRRMRSWLEGERAEPTSPLEAKVSSLIDVIGGQFSRRKHPRAFQSLLAIFNAQIRSLIQQKKRSLPYEIDLLDISLEKGGTSVLADGYLIDGHLEDRQSEFCFGFGALLQLCDDVQDVVQDSENGHMTLFSQTAGFHDLDRLTCKLWHFIDSVLESSLSGPKPAREGLKTMIAGNCRYLILEAVGRHAHLFSRPFRETMERAFPIRFRGLKSLRRKLTRIFEEEQTRRVADLNFISAVVLTAISRTISE